MGSILRLGRGLSAATSLLVAAVLGFSCATSVDGSGNGGSGGGCEDSESNCEGECVDLKLDNANCGECGAVCTTDNHCVDGACVSSCAMPLSACNGTCADLKHDNANCGTCGVACGTPFVCNGGKCSPPCQPGFSGCEGLCKDLQSDPENCGDCANVCGMQASCTAGQCHDICNAGLSYCSGICADLQTDETHCGSCTTSCLFSETCNAGTCTALCDAPLEYCNGQCIDKKTDENNCGSCGVLCTAGQTCNNGLCQCMGGVCGSCGVTNLGSTSPQTVSGTTTGGTDVLSGTCLSGFGPEAVYSFTAAIDGNYKFDVSGSSYDASVYVLSTACTELKCNAGFNGSKVALNLTANQTVYVVVDAGFTPSGNYVLNITNGPIVPCPANTVGALPATVTGDTTLGSDNGSASCGGAGGLEDTWAFTAPATATYKFDTSGSAWDTVIYVLNGTCGGAELGCNDDDVVSVQSELFVSLTANQTVVVVIDGYDEFNYGPYTLHVTQM